MTGRYVRKAVPLEIRAVQKVSGQHNVPLPEAADEDLPPDYINTVTRAINSYNTCSTPSISGRSSPAILGSNSLTVSHGGWTTGNTTERSTSVDSSCYSLDEFDRQAASTVNQHFEEFESMLFEGPKETVSRVYEECQEWLMQFPHIRVLGQQLLAPTDAGYNFVSSDSLATTPRPSTTQTLDLSTTDQTISSDLQGLTLSGRKVRASVPPVQSGRSSLCGQQPAPLSMDGAEFDFLHEEVIAQDGIYEDIIAVDYKDIYEDNMEHKKQITPRRRHVGYPPITPNACVKDSVLSGAFDHMWSEMISWLRWLLRRYCQEVDGKKSLGSLEHVMAPQRPVRASSFILTPRDAQEEMLPLLQVSKMALRDRNSHSMSIADMEGVQVEGGQAPFMPMQQTLVTRPSTMHHPRRRPSYSQHLDPLREPSKVPNMEEGRSSQPSPQNALRVKQIVPSGSHRLSSPPTNVPRHLPPLESSTGIVNPSHRKLGHRASSAIDNKEGRKHGSKERNIVNPEVSRPNTTQAFRSDTPFTAAHNNLRSSTPMVQGIPTRQMYSMGGASGGLNVMGNGLYPSTMETSAQGLEDTEGPPLDRHSQWIPSHSSFSVYKVRRTLRNW